MLSLTERQIKAIIPLNTVIHNGMARQEGFSYNKDADAVICPAGEISIRKNIHKHDGTGKNKSVVYTFDNKKCNHCVLKDTCFNPGAKSKSYSIRIMSDHHQNQLALEASAYFKQRMKKRKLIEHKNAELKRFHGLIRAKYYGLLRMRTDCFDCFRCKCKANDKTDRKEL